MIAAGLRSAALGLTGVLLGLHLAQLGVPVQTLGLVIGVGLAGMATGTTVVALRGDHWGKRRTLAVTASLAGGGLATVALGNSTGVLLAAAFVGMVNGMGRDRGPAEVLEQSMLAERVTDRDRTGAFARYALVQDVAGALGALAAGVPALIGSRVGVAPLVAFRWSLVGGAMLMLATVPLYLGLPADPRRSGDTRRAWWSVPLSPVAKRRVGGLAGLFAVDSLGGGFLAGSIITYWFFRRFGLGAEVLGPVFFVAKILNALSYVAAERLALRIGLIRTMVFTHLPSSLALCALPFIPSVWPAVALFLAREALVQMDVPTRQSYIAAVAAPSERTFALGVTGLVRNLGWAVGPTLAGLAMVGFGLGAPLLLGAGLKITYDLSLFAGFRNLRPPEETPATTA
jgi:MFS family permease